MLKRIKGYIDECDVRRFRFWFQLAAFALLIYGGYFFINLGQNLPTFSCAFNSERGGVCYLFPLQHQLSMTWKSVVSWRGFAVLTGFLTFIAWFILLNKAWCGYVCPLGTIQDWITNFRQRLGIRYSVYGESAFAKLKHIKYVLLVLLLLIPFGIANPVFGLPSFSHDMQTAFCKICPGRTVIPLFTLDASQLQIDFSTRTALVMTSLGVIITGIFLAGAFYRKRFFCFFCPMSALHFLLSKLALLKLVKDGSKCTRCGNCYNVCDVRIKEIADDVVSKNIVKEDCMMCFKCVAACPEKDCLKVKFAGVPVYSATSEGFFKRQASYLQKENKDGEPGKP